MGRRPTCSLRYKSPQCRCVLMQLSGRHTQEASSLHHQVVARQLTMQCRLLATTQKETIGLSGTVGVNLGERVALYGLSMGPMCVASPTKQLSSLEQVMKNSDKMLQV